MSGLKHLLRRIFPKVDLNDLTKKVDDLKLGLLNSQLEQRILFGQYQSGLTPSGKAFRFEDSGFSVFSQNDEDGKLLYIYSLIGFTNKKCVDMAFAYPYGSNVTNLLCNWGFTGLLVEGGDMKKSIEFFNSNQNTNIFPPTLLEEWISAENINDLCTANSFVGEIDLFSLDVDGVDYWLWKSLTAISPRVVVLEYQDILGSKESLTVPYSADFNRHNINPDFFGASLSAFVKLAKEKGYRLVGTNNLQYNAFFVRNDIVQDKLPEISIESCFAHPKVKKGILERYPKVKNLPWVKV